jgi:hypothetical protein
MSAISAYQKIASHKKVETYKLKQSSYAWGI